MPEGYSIQIEAKNTNMGDLIQIMVKGLGSIVASAEDTIEGRTKLLAKITVDLLKDLR